MNTFLKNTLFFSKERQKVQIDSFDKKLVKRTSKPNHINTPDLSKGIYILKATDPLGKLLFKKFIKD
ncbi:T9SS type A sorting domain-containing protein [Chryseobacterium sp. RP-3-3]|uniref:T9SS type A sorting domain-containing protein n=1 Tax=Chryseobacterium antibioticum TaxID=2728847 RepID=A0A7Y0FQ47_9FLAO|nr:T9SS type A sorting domain-containing protein [Chryseobacterium antibioticum]